MILDEFIELWQALLQYFYDYEKYVDIDKDTPPRLENEARVGSGKDAKVKHTVVLKEFVGF